MIQEWILNIYAEVYESNIYAKLYKPYEKKKINRVDSGEHWPTPIKETIQWFPFITIIEHTANNMKKRADIIIIKGVCHAWDTIKL